MSHKPVAVRCYTSPIDQGNACFGWASPFPHESVPIQPHFTALQLGLPAAFHFGDLHVRCCCAGDFEDGDLVVARVTTLEGDVAAVARLRCRANPLRISNSFGDRRVRDGHDSILLNSGHGDRGRMPPRSAGAVFRCAGSDPTPTVYRINHGRRGEYIEPRAPSFGGLRHRTFLLSIQTEQFTRKGFASPLCTTVDWKTRMYF